MTGAGLIGWAIDAIIASTLLLIVILLLRAKVRQVAGAQIAYALWALPVLRLVLPPLPHWPAAIATPVSQAGETIVVLMAPAVVPTLTVQPAAAFPIGSILLAAWLFGAVLFVGWHAVNHRRFCRRIVGGAISVEAIDGVRIIESTTAPGPIAFGIIERYVAFPVGLADRYDADERALALAHELGHHARGDLIANWIALVVLAIHWFNPVAWRAFRAFRADQELATDARVLAGRSITDRHIYACAIVKAAHGGAVSAACHLHTITDLKGRLKMLTTTPASRRRFALGATTVGAIVVAGLGLTASGSSAAAISAGVQEAVAPAVPAAPPAPTIELNTSTNPDGSTTVEATGRSKVKRIVVVKGGKTRIYEGKDAEAFLKGNAWGRNHPQPPVPPQPPEAPTSPDGYASTHTHGMRRDGSSMIVSMPGEPGARVEVQDIPIVSQGKCGIGKGKPSVMVIESRQGEKRKLVVCTDRIQKVTADAMADAMVSVRSSGTMERNAYSQGLTGLLNARQKVVADTGMGEPDRARALGAIDQSIVELKSQLARMD